jgi:hypothetical protein
VAKPTPDVGQARKPLAEPEQVGTISVAEAGEIRERKRLREKYEADLKAKQDELSDVAKVVTLLRVENEQFLQRLLRDRSLPLEDDYNVQSETGLIWRTAEAIRPREVTIEETTPVAVSASDSEA